jgi:hypothetical protein
MTAQPEIHVKTVFVNQAPAAEASPNAMVNVRRAISARPYHLQLSSQGAIAKKLSSFDFSLASVNCACVSPTTKTDDLACFGHYDEDKKVWVNEDEYLQRWDRNTIEFVVPPSTSPKTGTLIGTFNPADGRFDFVLSYSLTNGATVGAIYGPAADGQTGETVHDLNARFSIGCAACAYHFIVPEEIRNDLMSGRWYVEYRTGAYPAGEIRGQIQPIHH